MPNAVVVCPNVTIPNGTSVSNEVKAREVFQDADAIALFAPAALDAHTYVIEVCPDIDATSPTWSVLNDAVSDVGPPAAGKAVVYPAPAISAFRIKDQTGNVAADRTWKMTKIYNYR
jgi:hypothetical protein